jgi:uncharacterized membrane protein YbhN (UPF0104 family)
LRLARRRWWRPALLVVGVAVAVLELRGHLPSAASTWTALQRSRPGWLLAAVALEAVSMGAFAEQQRQLLAAFGVRVSASVSLAVSYARSAMSMALPAGSAVSAGYAFRQFRAQGASQPVAAAVMLLSGVASVAGLALLSAGDAALTWLSRPVLLAAAVALLVAAVAGRRRLPHSTAWATAASAPVATVPVPVATGSVPVAVGSAPRPAATAASPVARLRDTLRDTAAMARSVPARRWVVVIALAAVNWLTDLACLVAAVRAVGLAVPAATIVVAYLAAQLVRQIPITPGGIGVIEASLVLALTAAGAATAPAAAAVLIYRLLSGWAVLPIGLACWAARKPRVTTSALPTA